VPFLLAQLGRTFWTIVNAPNAVFRDHFEGTHMLERCRLFLIIALGKTVE
jgi:low temperature requirement protein LtrA